MTDKWFFPCIVAIGCFLVASISVIVFWPTVFRISVAGGILFIIITGCLMWAEHKGLRQKRGL